MAHATIRTIRCAVSIPAALSYHDALPVDKVYACDDLTQQSQQSTGDAQPAVYPARSVPDLSGG